MEGTVNQLEAMFNKADSDLNYLERKLDFEFTKEGSGEGQVNPQQMVKKIHQVKKEYGDIVKDIQGIQEAQQETMDFFRSQLKTATDMLQKLQNQTGQENEEPPDLKAIESLLGITLPSNAPQSNGACAIPSGETTQTIPNQEGTTHVPSETPQQCSDTQFFSDDSLSPSALRKDSDQCIDVTQEEFETVSSLVRGRVKLSDVNLTYQRLWRHFKEEGNSNELGTQEMHKMGLKVTGATGEAKLKVLKALKLITMDRKGCVNLT